MFPVSKKWLFTGLVSTLSDPCPHSMSMSLLWRLANMQPADHKHLELREHMALLLVVCHAACCQCWSASCCMHCPERLRLSGRGHHLPVMHAHLAGAFQADGDGAASAQSSDAFSALQHSPSLSVSAYLSLGVFCMRPERALLLMKPSPLCPRAVLQACCHRLLPLACLQAKLAQVTHLVQGAAE